METSAEVDLEESKYYFDLDGTLLKGPASWGALFSELLARTPFVTSGYLAALKKVTETSLPDLSVWSPAQKTGLKAAWKRWWHSGRELQKHAKEMLEELANPDSPVVQLAVLTGRGESVLRRLTEAELERLEIISYFKSENENRIFLKPSGWSSAAWKMAFLKEQAERSPSTQLVLVENDVRTAVWVSDMAMSLGMRIQVVLLESIETSSLVLKAIGLNRTILLEKGIRLVKSLDEITNPGLKTK
ncbi:MAG: hypothetical protein COU67_03600 [Candidatus Pacebacteria bacterium CG10_big_fil_rev_8_21_14_0_10_44_54]|uniref:Uncharacterized protein n=1 Tax=Candidatus Lloydbacteria bacterium CG22_combo_CG10-13_8_21_14_all_47_15 TaxID=1974635 RepID=A0A2H0CVK1_9BACT|nr:MAG: hypothetical protein COW88_00990 [Candidatus Lloydbacteria bacterium CG22_combo_CG10-13_8_21_14_all_47_15]PIR60106.1 MAG: hypothetical protein COU67_03600 [Candidatus Pacebacteria bacterium CG10_big_fil_rev_8_21_14_0_10_44_54]